MDIADYRTFETPRPGQEEAIRWIDSTFEEHDFAMIQAATGTGKSHIGMTKANEYGSGIYLPHTKNLQDQLVASFGPGSGNKRMQVSVSVVKGRKNFQCLRTGASTDRGQCKTTDDPDWQCIYAPIPRDSWEEPDAVSQRRGKLFWQSEKHCPYYDQKLAGLNAGVVIGNYAYFIGEPNSVGDFGTRPLLVCDEAHNIEDLLLNYVRVTLDLQFLEEQGLLPDIPLSYDKAGVVSDNGDAIRYLGVLVEKISRKDPSLQMRMFPEYASTKLEERLALLHNECLEMWKLMQEDADNFVVYQEDERHLVYAPLFASRFSKRYLFRLGEKVLLMSATILDPALFARTLGIRSDEYAYLEQPSHFPVENRLIRCRFAGKMSRNERDATMPRAINYLERILKNHATQKGIVHTHSYDIAKRIAESIATEYKDRLLFHDDSAGAQIILNKHLKGKKPTVLVTPSMGEGIDLAGEQAEFAVIMKMPYLNLGDPVVNRKQAFLPDWYWWKAAQLFMQETGRHVRSADDFGLTYVLDESFAWFEEKWGGRFFPAWFKEAILL